MPRISGRNGVVYANLTSGGTAEPIAYLNNWALTFTVNNIDVTAFGDVSKVYVGALPDFKGTYAGFYDTSTVQMYTAAVDGVARKFYLYPDRTNTAQYWFGTAIFDMSITAGVDGAVAISGNLAAASASSKVG